jgi:hypothetical protein
MKNLHRAFPETPEYVASAIRDGVRRARRRDIRRRRLYAASAVAAALCLLIGGLSLAMRKGPPGRQNVRGPLSRGIASPIPSLIPSPTPMPTPMPTPEHPSAPPTVSVSPLPIAPTLEPPESAVTESPLDGAAESAAMLIDGADKRLYFSTPGGQFYHIDSSCSGMVGAQPRPLAEAQKFGQAACPICLNDGGERYFYSTSRGMYYHTDSRCSGMVGALVRAQTRAEAMGQNPCPDCVGVGALERGPALEWNSDGAMATARPLLTEGEAERLKE